MKEEKIQELINYTITLYDSHTPVDGIKKALNRQGADDESAMKIIQIVDERKDKVKIYERKVLIIIGCVLLLFALLEGYGGINFWILMLVGLFSITGGVASIVTIKRKCKRRGENIKYNIMNKQTSNTGSSREELKSKFGNAIMDSLSEEGFRPELVENNIIVFKVEGSMLSFELDDEDEDFARLCFYNFYEVTDENKALVLYNMNDLNINRKYAKLGICCDHVSVVIDILPVENIRLIVSRMIRIIINTAKAFQYEMNKGFSCN
jgi:hypothetical protein